MDNSTIDNKVFVGKTISPVILHLAMVLFALIAGFFYAYSVDIMRGLDLIKPSSAIEAMQAISLAVRNPVFFITFFLTPIVAIFSAYLLKQEGNRVPAYLMAMAAAAYTLGAFFPTILINVPMNEALALVEMEGNNTNLIWSEYSERWTLWNTIRTIFSVLSVVLASVSIAYKKNL